jgi:hypothetical protein
MNDYAATPVITKHAKKRLKQRGGISPRLQPAEAAKAFLGGSLQKDQKGRLRRMLDANGIAYASHCRIYRNLLWAFKINDDTPVLITVIGIPHWLQNQINTKEEE